jgi:hypothetical protein
LAFIAPTADRVDIAIALATFLVVHRRHENLAGVDVLPTIHHGNFLQNNSSSTARHGLHHRLWAGRAFTGPWATPPTAGAMKIKRVVVYNPTIHHGYLLEKNRHPGRRQGHERRPLPPVPCKSSGGLCSNLFIFINILFILINPSCPRVLVSQHKQQSIIIWLGITRLGSAQLGGEMLF